jgi:hypothetical protein
MTASLYPWLKALHIIAITAWMAGMSSTRVTGLWNIGRSFWLNRSALMPDARQGYSITSSARSSNDSGMVRPIA